MQDILTCAMGLDVHRDIIVACLVKGAVDAEPEAETRTFSTLIPEMQKLRDWVIESECRNIAMESTGIYWQPIYEMLESCFDGEISILVVNARHMKNVPGRKTDMKDAQWIATLLRAGLLKGSFIFWGKAEIIVVGCIAGGCAGIVGIACSSNKIHVATTIVLCFVESQNITNDCPFL